MCKLHKILETLSQGSIPSENDIGFLLNCKEDELQPLFLLAREVQHSVYGRDVYIRGLIEFTNYCKMCIRDRAVCSSPLAKYLASTPFWR